MSRKPVSHDNHHLLHSRHQWNAEPMGQALRQQPSLIFHMNRMSHERIHATTPAVPLLGHNALMGTLNRYEPRHDPTKDIDGLCMAIDKTVRGERFHQLERDLAGLAIETIMLQKPMILDGIVR